MSAIKKLTPVLAICLIAGLAVSGCNTMRGAGKDIQKGGEAVEDAAENVQDDMKDKPAARHLIVASADPGGSINPPGVTVIDRGKSETFTIAPNPGYHVADVLVDGKSVGAVHRHTFDTPSGDHTISARFTQNPNR